MTEVKENLIHILGIEPLAGLMVLAILSYAFYKIFLGKLKESRHLTLRNLFKKMIKSFVVFSVFWAAQFFFQKENIDSQFFIYLGTGAVITGAVFFVRTVKVIAFEYLFFNSMSVAVPALIVDMATLLFAIFIAAWLSTSVFGVKLAPLLATSAILSVVLGLALQDTLGNLFAGVALQFDKPYEIGDWIEVHAEKEMFAGEVHEITWRATILTGFFDEVITVPNRLAAQSEISNYSARKKPIYRGVTVVLDADAPEHEVRAVFIDVLKKCKGVIQGIEHMVMLRDLNEKGAHWRLFYPVTSYGRQYIILDEILVAAQTEFKKRGIQIGRLRADVKYPEKNG